MKRRTAARWTCAAALFLSGCRAPALSTSGVDAPSVEHVAALPTGFPASCAPNEVQVMLLGTYHFAGSASDVAKRATDDVMLPARQHELDVLTEALARWKPDQVAVEWPYSFADSTQRRYSAYRSGTLPPTSNEVVQLGFRLATRLGLATVDPIDEPMGLGGDSATTLLARRADLRRISDDAMAAVQREVDAAATDAAHSSIAEQLLRMNSDAALHGGNSEGMFAAMLPLAEGRNRPGPEIIAKWYTRNVLMTHNLYESLKPGTHRLLLLVGAGHVPPLRHLLDEAPQFCPVSPLAVLQSAR